MKIPASRPTARNWPELFRRPAVLAAALSVLVVAAYSPLRNHEFIVYDDPIYVLENPYVATGFSWLGIKHAFLDLHSKETYWHPITWFSHMADAQWFGLDPGMHHLVSVFFHTANVVLLFLGLHWLTGKFLPALLAAALFAVHPLGLDSVAWVAERKNLLHAMFGFLTIGAYSQYVRRGDKRWYGGALLLFALGLMSKPPLVTLPFALLLLDYWPLDRLSILVVKAEGEAPPRGGKGGKRWERCSSRRFRFFVFRRLPQPLPSLVTNNWTAWQTSPSSIESAMRLSLMENIYSKSHGRTN